MEGTMKVDLQDRFASFELSTHTYKRVDNAPILVDVLIPKKLIQESSDSRKVKRPVMIRIHGGWLVLGKRDYPLWFSAWALELALKHDAIIVNPDYRLLPEARTDDILDDMDDLWKWICHDLGNEIQDLDSCKGIQVDLGRILVLGDSAGGYLAVHTAISCFNPESKESVRAMIAVYPMVDLRSPFWTTDYPKQVLDFPQFPNSIIDDFLASIANSEERTVVSNTETDDPRRVPLGVALTQHGRYLEVLGTDRDPAPGKRRIRPEDRIVDGKLLPPALFLHGADDTAVPRSGTENFVELLRKRKAVQGLDEGMDEKKVLRLVVVPGEHGFENDFHIDEAEWMEESMTFVEKHWLG
ncbi:hypothetical protein ACEPAI_2787 [Sanghuangporus weigelae]